MTSSYYVFYGNPECGRCSSRSGYYTVTPARPHPNCGCQIVKIDEGDCGNFDYNGAGWPGDPHGAPVKDIGGGKEIWRIEVKVTKRNRSTETVIIEVEVPADMPHDDKMDAIGHAAEDAAERIEDCKPPLVS